MEIGQQALQRGVRLQEARSPIDILKEGHIFSGKTIKLLPGQMAEIAALGQKLTAQLETPLQAGERYTFQVVSLDRGVSLRVLAENPAAKLPADQVSVLLEKMGLQPTKENMAFTAAALQNGTALSKSLIQTASGWLGKSGAEGIEVVRFMLSRHLPITENVFQSLAAARSTGSMTEKLGSLQQLLVQNGFKQSEAAKAIGRLLGETAETFAFKGTANEKAVQLASALQGTDTPEKAAAIRVLGQSMAANPSLAAQHGEALLAGIARSSEPSLNQKTELRPVQLLKQALSQLTGSSVSEKAVTAFKQALSLSLPLGHPERPALMQQLAQLADGFETGQSLSQRTAASLLQLASSAAVSLPDQAAARMAVLIGTDALSFEEPPASSVLRDAFRFLGVDHEAVLASRENIQNAPQTVKQELIKLMSDTMPAPIKEAAEQLVGRLNAQHILSAESGPVQQLVLQSPLQFGEFKGDVTIKWEGKKKADGKIDADFCRVLFYVEMPRLKQTVIDMQVQNRIVYLHIAAEIPGPLLKKISSPAVDSLKEALEAGGYRLSGVSFKEPAALEKEKPPLARIMDDDRYMGVDIRI
ncbi:hypothetical protein RRU94_19705 [Domibacillus sp. DTU_2020_1001157_1_SI_ALB_TIR_016]|uniref:hypothetical protein n=1 Tax=Domibacillus sp. DTU_2020_1001157_1_SI_ALB_TIR_016 TaxID=3077789 RepID=UPI0028E5B57E|nr:hypothetical protein [Domibacillus sp. DTU_2020_1001157_1_SI_ALB_TIR_016]WNS79743.1 hypothetical protein RRU94_19705 [Domibacillus sp. DTU_2020_1001157_1_SI_ALB_TIR_016]